MMNFSQYLLKEIPFKDVIIHGLIRDSQGRKMSKSLNNGIDPFDVIKQYGIDVMRLFLRHQIQLAMILTLAMKN